MKIKVVASTHKSASNINHLVGKVFEAKKTADSSRVEIIDGNEVIPLFEGEWEEVKFLIKVPKVDGMTELLKRFIAEKSQLEDHMKHGELHQYIDDNAADLMHLFNRCIQLMSKGAEQDAA